MSEWSAPSRHSVTEPPGAALASHSPRCSRRPILSPCLACRSRVLVTLASQVRFATETGRNGRLRGGGRSLRWEGGRGRGVGGRTRERREARKRDREREREGRERDRGDASIARSTRCSLINNGRAAQNKSHASSHSIPLQLPTQHNPRLVSAASQVSSDHMFRLQPKERTMAGCW